MNCGVRIVEFGMNEFLSCTLPFGHVGEHKHENPRVFELPEVLNVRREIEKQKWGQLPTASQALSQAQSDLQFAHGRVKALEMNLKDELTQLLTYMQDQNISMGDRFRNAQQRLEEMTQFLAGEEW